MHATQCQPDTALDVSYLQRLSGLQRLRIAGAASLATCNILSPLASLVTVSICDMAVVDLFALRELSQLRVLKLASVGQLANLDKLAHLTRVSFRDTAAPANLSSLTGLRSLRLAERSALPVVTALSGLTALHLTDDLTGSATPSVFDYLLHLPSLRLLDAGAECWTGVQAPHLFCLTALALRRMTPHLRLALPSLTRLCRLDLGWSGTCGWTAAQGAGITSQSITSLCLECVPELPFALPSMHGLASLSVLQLRLTEGCVLVESDCLPAKCTAVESHVTDGQLFFEADSGITHRAMDKLSFAKGSAS